MSSAAVANMNSEIHVVLGLLVFVFGGVDMTINKGPTNSLMIAGQSVSLICRTNNGNCGGIDWKKQEGNASPKPVFQDNQGMLNADVFPPARYTVNMSPGGNCTLTITNLILGDSGKFICIETANGGQDTKSAVLVVIDTGSNTCASNASTELVKGEGYLVQCAVSVPPKTTEPTIVNLSLYAGDEGKLVATNSSAELQNSNLAVSYTASAEPPEMPRYRCSASFSPETQPNYDTTPAKIDRVCETPAKNVLYGATNIRTLPKHSDNKVRSGDNCTADGYPQPTYVWRNVKTGRTWSGSNFTLDPAEVDMDNFTCTASNTVRRQPYSVSMSISGTTAQADDGGGLSGGAIAGIIIGVLALGGAIAAGVYFGHRYMAEKKGSEKPVETGNLLTPRPPSTDTGMPSTKPPDKPPRMSDNVHHRSDQRPDSDATQYVQLRQDSYPYQKPSNTRDDSTVYATVKEA